MSKWVSRRPGLQFPHTELLGLCWDFSGTCWSDRLGFPRDTARVAHGTNVCSLSAPQVGEVSGLQVYPVKSCQGYSMKTMHLDRFGAVNDRCLPSLSHASPRCPRVRPG